VASADGLGHRMRVKAMAKRYRFRLETLLRLRQQREDEKKRIVASRLRKIRSLEQHKQVLETRIAEQTEIIRGLLVRDQMDVDELKAGRHWMIRLRRGVLEAGGALSSNRAMLAQERADLANARKETKVLERLKEKQQTAFSAELERLDRIEADDLNVTRFAHALTVEECDVV
jgi:flagellar protein FliJ